jgi:uncharacterized BrkB/YihY/UPF0761 family membrane protein
MEKQIIDTANNLIKNGNEIMMKIYEIALKQQKIKQIIWGLISLTFICSFIIGALLFVKGLKEKKNGTYSNEYETYYIVGTLIAVFSLFLFFAFFYDFLTFTFNPQYAALNDIIDILKGK